jgi:hypothetical protein
MSECCNEHSGHEKRIDRAEKDIELLNKRNDEKNRSAWQYVGMAVLAILSMLINIGMAVMNYVKGGQ